LLSTKIAVSRCHWSTSLLIGIAVPDQIARGRMPATGL
jgi:hypothetical protein